MELKISAPGLDLNDDDRDRVQRDLEKIDRRLKDYELVYAEVRINGKDGGAPVRAVTIEVEYGRNHLVAKAEDKEWGQAVRQARDEIMRQIDQTKRAKSHSDYTKH